MSDFRNLGPKGEKIAEEYLIQQGYSIIETNYENDIGEIDIIAKDDDEYCFIEVKTRDNDAAGSPLEAITPDKQYRLHKTALRYIQKHDLFDEYARFDVVGITLSEAEPHIELIKNAFDVSSL